MTIQPLHHRHRSHRAGRWLRLAVTSLMGSLALLLGLLISPATALSAADPDAPFQLPQYDWSSNWSDIFSGPDDADYLRSGGVACAKPEALPAHNADGDHGYRVPFTMALTDGRAIAGYSPLALEAGQFPFGSAAYGVTGWVRGWVELPSMRITIPDNGTTLCAGSGAVWANLPVGAASAAPGTFANLTAGSTFVEGTTNYAWSELSPSGPPQASISGLTAEGGLEFQASMPIEVGLKQGDGASKYCTISANVDLSTAAAPIPSAFSKIDGALPSDPSDWRSQSDYDKFYSNPFDMKSTPPDHYYMPPRALAGAITGQTATVANATMTLPPVTETSQCSRGPAGGGFGDKVQAILAPISLDGSQQPSWPVIPSFGCSFPGFPCELTPTPWYTFVKFATLMPLFEIPAGSVQTSVDITIDDIGLQQGLPSGYGFTE